MLDINASSIWNGWSYSIAAVDIGVQMLKNKLEGKDLTDINYKEVAVAAVARFVTSGVSAIFRFSNWWHRNGCVKDGSFRHCLK